MKNLYLVFNIASNYRQSIYHLLDATFHCNWFFGANNSTIKSLDLNILSRVSIGENVKLYGNFYWQKGAFRFVCNSSSQSTLLLLGNPYYLSTWLIMFYSRIFYPSRYIYLWTHGWYGHESLVKRIIKKLFYALADGIFLYGNYAKTMMIAEGFRSEKLFVIHNSLDYDKQIALRNSIEKEDIFLKHFGNKNKTLVFIGRLTKVKKLNLIIDAISMLRDKGLELNLVFVGDGEEKEKLALLAKQKNLFQNIWFYGASYDEEINAKLIFNADLCVSPGNVGLTAIHSLMFGTPVITHSAFKYQMPECEAIKVGKTGAFFQKDNIYSLANTIYDWFLNKDTNREELRQNCYHEIDTQWTPKFQLNIFLKNLKFKE